MPINKDSSERAKFHFMFNLIRGIARSFEEDLEKHSKKNNLSVSQQQILYILWYNGGSLTMKELSKQSLLHTSTVTRIVDVLNKKNYIRRERLVDEDSRFVKVYLTDQGSQKLSETICNLKISEVRIFNYLLECNNYEEIMNLLEDMNRYLHGEEYIKWIDTNAKKFTSL